MFKLNIGNNMKNKNENNERVFMRPGTIEEEPDSMDSIISNVSAFPITVIPANNMVRSSTQVSFSRFSRQSSTRCVIKI